MIDKYEMIKLTVLTAVVFLLMLLLSGCTRTVATDSVLESVKKQTDVLERSLPKECKTEVVMAQIAAIRSQTDAVSAVCNTEKREIIESRDKWKLGFFLLLIIAGVGFLRRIKKYV